MELTKSQSQNPSSSRSSQHSNPIVTKAEKLLGDLAEVTKYSKLYVADDMRKVITAIDADMAPASRDDSTSLAALLIGKCRANGLQNGPISGKDFSVYALGIQEAFAKYPASVGMQACDGGSGLPSLSPFWPKPFDIVKFCEAILAKRRTAKVMAQRHITEFNRRQAEREGEAAPPTAEQKARVAALVDSFKNSVRALPAEKGFT